MNLINILLVDDNEIVRTGIKTYLNMQLDLQVVAEASSEAEAIFSTQQERPDVIVLDITMEGLNGLNATRKIKQVTPNCKVLALSNNIDKSLFFAMLEAGADGILTKQAAADDLIYAIQSIADGNVYLQPNLTKWLIDDYRRSTGQKSEGINQYKPSEDAKNDLRVLSERERQVLELVSEGDNNREIGKKLGISPNTVSRHRERIMSKLDLHSCAELVKFAIRTGLIELD